MKTITTFLSVLLLLTLSCKQKPTPGSASEGVKPAAELSEGTQKMITARVYIKPGSEEEFIKAAQWIIDLTRKEEGCLEYTLFQDPYNRSNFFFFERYKNQAAVDAHFAAPYFKEFGDKVGPLTTQAAEIKVWDIKENQQNQ